MLTPRERERLIIALQADDIIADLNAVMAEHDAVLVLDWERYRQPRLRIEIGGSTVTWMDYDLTSRKPYTNHPKDHTFIRFLKAVDRALEPYEGRVTFTGENGEAIVWVQVRSSLKAKLPILRTKKGSLIRDTRVHMPEVIP